jgi:N utilization substance protein A
MNAEVTVPDSQLSLAIGKEGQNARLAAKLTGWRIDIKSETQGQEEAARKALEALTPKAEPEKVAKRSEKVAAGRCQAVTSSGKQCTHQAKPGSNYCGIPAHQKLAEEEMAEETGGN